MLQNVRSEGFRVTMQRRSVRNHRITFYEKDFVAAAAQPRLLFNSFDVICGFNLGQIYLQTSIETFITVTYFQFYNGREKEQIVLLDLKHVEQREF